MSAIILTSPQELKTLIQESVKDVVGSLTDKITNDLMSSTSPEWLTRFQMAQKENVSVSMVDKLRRQGRYDVRKLGRKTLLKIKSNQAC